MTAPKRGTGLRPAFTRLWAAYLPNYRVERPALYTELGIQTLNDDPSFTNTCAIRVSYALAKVGLPVTKGGLKIQAGPHKGKRLEPGMRNLANYLARSDRWGEPEKFIGEDAARRGIGRRTGVVAFFFPISGTLFGSPVAQGHIDLIAPSNGFLQCAGQCFFSPEKEIWFWALD